MPPICTSMLAKFYSCKKQVLHLEGSSMDNGIVLLSESSSWMDIFDVLASGMIVFGGGGTRSRPSSILGALWMP
jgi:hypothetical protein